MISNHDYKITKPVIVKQVNNLKSRKRNTYNLNYTSLFWIFFLGSLFGVIIETLWCLITRHRYESRVGVIYGPFNPLYGFGAVLFTVLLKRLSDKRDLWIFLGSMVIGGAFEYLCSLLQELVFGTVSWEYSHTQFNFDGRTNLVYSFIWGLLGLIWIKEILPLIFALISRISPKINKWLVVVLTVFMLFDIGISVLALSRQSQRRLNQPATNVISQFFDEHYPDDFLERKYPNMMVVR